MFYLVFLFGFSNCLTWSISTSTKSRHTSHIHGSTHAWQSWSFHGVAEEPLCRIAQSSEGFIVLTCVLLFPVFREVLQGGFVEVLRCVFPTELLSLDRWELLSLDCCLLTVQPSGPNIVKSIKRANCPFQPFFITPFKNNLKGQVSQSARHKCPSQVARRLR